MAGGADQRMPGGGNIALYWRFRSATECKAPWISRRSHPSWLQQPSQARPASRLNDRSRQLRSSPRKQPPPTCSKSRLRKSKPQKARTAPQSSLLRTCSRTYGKAGPELEAAAKADGVTVPTSIDADSKKKVDALASADSANLDQAYLSTQLTAHQDAVKLFEQYSKSGPDGQLKNTAGKILPDLRMHLVRVQGLTSK